MDRFELAPGLIEEILAHARECYPEEACGIIAGGDKRGTRLHRGINRSFTPRIAYVLDAETLVRLTEFESAGLTMSATYHSHPAGPETPSGLDIQRGSEEYPDTLQIICSLADRGRPVVRAFRTAGGRATEVLLSERAMQLDRSLAAK
jgi:proteasome lid subunit RPN8/RPN11